MGPHTTKILRDPVHGDIELSAEEIRLIDTAQFQRLRGVKQLGTANLVFPGATHTRFEHSLGTVHMTGQLVAAINRNAARDPSGCRAISDEECRIVRFAALLHDVTHIPFGHNLEDQTGLLERHDAPARFAKALGDSELGAILEDLGVRDEVLAILCGRDAALPGFMRQLLSDTVDADLLDYLRRDAYYTGLELSYDRRVIEYFRVERGSEEMFVDCERGGMLREDIVSELTRVLESRYHFSERVYYHHAKVAAGALLARMVEIALRSGALTPQDLHVSTDQSLVDRLARTDTGTPELDAQLRRFSRAFAARQLPKRVLVLPEYLNRGMQDELLGTYFTPGRPEPRFAWEREMEARARREFGRDVDVIMYCPARRMQLKEARTRVRMPGSGCRTVPMAELASELPRLSDLQESYLRLWKLYVFTSEADPSARRLLQRLCLEHLPGCRNALSL